MTATKHYATHLGPHSIEAEEALYSEVPNRRAIMTTKQSSIVKMHPAFTKTNAFFVRLYLASGETASLFQSDLKMLGYAGYSEELYRIELLGQAIRFSRTPIPVNIRKDGEYWKITSIQPRTNERPDQPPPPFKATAVRETAIRQAKNALTAFDEGAVVWDTETTGTDPVADEIIQFGYVTQNKAPRNVTFRPSEDILDVMDTSSAAAVHGIKAADLKDCPTFSRTTGRLLNLLSAKAWIGYNIPFDATFLNYKFWQLGSIPPVATAMFDVMALSAMYMNTWDSDKERFAPPKLTDIAAHFGYRFDAHNAANDAAATLYVLRNIATGGNQP